MPSPHELITAYMREKFGAGMPELTLHIKNRPVDEVDEWAEDVMDAAYDNIDELAQGLLDYLQSGGFMVAAIDPTRLS